MTRRILPTVTLKSLAKNTQVIYHGEVHEIECVHYSQGKALIKVYGSDKLIPEEKVTSELIEYDFNAPFNAGMRPPPFSNPRPEAHPSNIFKEL
jgi:hypothetical protein